MSEASGNRYGWSTQAWTSLAVKSWRIGWLAGWLAAERVLAPSSIRAIAAVQIFEDTAPTVEGAARIAQDVLALNWPEALARETHHGKGYTEQAVYAAVKVALPVAPRLPEARVRDMREESLRLHLSLPPRAWYWWYGWHHRLCGATGLLTDTTRQLYDEPFRGMPDAALDLHTPEGKALGQFAGGEPMRRTAWSGDAAGHLAIAKTVKDSGWEPIREHALVLAKGAEERHRWFLDGTAEQRPLFG